MKFMDFWHGRNRGMRNLPPILFVHHKLDIETSKQTAAIRGMSTELRSGERVKRIINNKDFNIVIFYKPQKIQKPSKRS